MRGLFSRHWWIPASASPRKFFRSSRAPIPAHVLRTKIFVSEALNQSQMAKQDVFTFDPRSRGAAHYESIVPRTPGAILITLSQ